MTPSRPRVERLGVIRVTFYGHDSAEYRRSRAVRSGRYCPGLHPISLPHQRLQTDRHVSMVDIAPRNSGGTNIFPDTITNQHLAS
jgi:hypothetical protein